MKSTFFIPTEESKSFTMLTFSISGRITSENSDCVIGSLPLMRPKMQRTISTITNGTAVAIAWLIHHAHDLSNILSGNGDADAVAIPGAEK
jgi:hypothetical protein